MSGGTSHSNWPTGGAGAGVDTPQAECTELQPSMSPVDGERKRSRREIELGPKVRNRADNGEAVLESIKWRRRWRGASMDACQAPAVEGPNDEEREACKNTTQGNQCEGSINQRVSRTCYEGLSDEERGMF